MLHGPVGDASTYPGRRLESQIPATTVCETHVRIARYGEFRGRSVWDPTLRNFTV